MHAVRATNTRGRGGFTMIELVVVIVVGGIVTATAAPKIRDLLAQQRVARAATAVQNDLEAAYAISSRNRQPIHIVWDVNSMQMEITDRAGTVFYRKISLGADAYGLRTADVTFSRTTLEVYPNGLANDTLAIYLRGNNTNKLVRMTRAGMVRIE